MTQTILSDIYIYPVKSLAGIKVSTWSVNEKGLLHDRKWMLIDSNNHFLSQRRVPKMILIKTQIVDDTLILSTATSGSISLPLMPETGEDIITTIWKDQCIAKTTTQEADQWLSDFLNIKCKLVYQPEDIVRQVDPDYAIATDLVNFSDGFPFLIVSEASLTALNQEMEQHISMLRFRPNLVISNCKSYEEDTWRTIKINDISFRLPKPCSRCSVPTIDTETGETNKEPLTTLSRLRCLNNKVYFGQNALHDNNGRLSINSTVEIIKTGQKQPLLSF